MRLDGDSSLSPEPSNAPFSQIRGFAHPDQRARFSRARSSREPKALTIQATTRRSDTIRANFIGTVGIEVLAKLFISLVYNILARQEGSQ